MTTIPPGRAAAHSRMTAYLDGLLAIAAIASGPARMLLAIAVDIALTVAGLTLSLLAFGWPLSGGSRPAIPTGLEVAGVLALFLALIVVMVLPLASWTHGLLLGHEKP